MAGDERDFEGRSRAAQAKAAHALDRLLKLAETRDSGQIRRVARFIAALYNGDAYPLDLFELRAVDVAISDDVINCIDALRWGACRPLQARAGGAEEDRSRHQGLGRRAA